MQSATPADENAASVRLTLHADHGKIQGRAVITPND